MGLFIAAPAIPNEQIEFVSASTSAVSGTENQTVTTPPGAQEGDFLIVTGMSTLSRTVTFGASWGDFGALNQGTRPSAQSASQIIRGAPPENYSFTWSGDNGAGGLAILCYRNISRGSSFTGDRTLNQLPQTNTSVAPSIAPLRSGVLVSSFGIDVETTVLTPPAGMTQRALINMDGGTFAVYDEAPSPAGTIAANSLVWGATGRNIGWQTQVYRN